MVNATGMADVGIESGAGDSEGEANIDGAADRLVVTRRDHVEESTQP